MKQLTLLVCFWLLALVPLEAQNGIIVFQTDFGLKDGAVSAMKGVANQVSPALKLYDLTHEIPAYNIWEAAYRLDQTARYWPKGTVFVSVVDPGVGTSRKAVVLLTKSGHYFVTPDNGTLTLVAQSLGISQIRQIDEKRNRLPGSESSHTFHGRDVFAYTAARLASGKILFSQVGPMLDPKVVEIPFEQAHLEKGQILGNIPLLDVQYGNVWTNIPESLFKQLGLSYGDSVKVRVFENGRQKYEGKLPYVKTFESVAENQPLCYINSLLNFSLALNQGDFASRFNVKSGPLWTVMISK